MTALTKLTKWGFCQFRQLPIVPFAINGTVPVLHRCSRFTPNQYRVDLVLRGGSARRVSRFV